MRIVFNQNYDSVLSKQMLAMTNIEIVQLNPDSGESKAIKKRQASVDIMQLQEQFSSPQLKRVKTSADALSQKSLLF